MSKSTADRILLRKLPLRTGITLHYAEVQEGPARPAIFLHGLADSWRSFQLILPMLSERWRILAPDFRGHGESDKPEGRYGMDILAEDLLAFMEALGLEKADIVGHSMGSFVGQLFAARFPGRVKRLILLGSAPSVKGNTILIELKRTIDSLTDPISREFIAGFQEPSKPVPPEFMETIISESMKIPANILKAAYTGVLEIDNQPILPHISAPVFIAWGKEDGVFNRRDQELLLSAIPDAVLKEYDAGHNIHWEKPEELAADLIAWSRGR